MKTCKLLWNILIFFQPNIWCIWCVSRFGTTSLIAKPEKHLRQSVIFSKVPSCKPTSLLKLTFHSSTKTDTSFLF